MDFNLIHRHPVLEVAVEPVGLLDQHHAHGRMDLQIRDHFAEGGAADLLGRLNVYVFLRHSEALRRRVVLEQLVVIADQRGGTLRAFKVLESLPKRLGFPVNSIEAFFTGSLLLAAPP